MNLSLSWTTEAYAKQPKDLNTLWLGCLPVMSLNGVLPFKTKLEVQLMRKMVVNTHSDQNFIGQPL